MSVKRMTYVAKIGDYNLKMFKLLGRERTIRPLGSGLAADVSLVTVSGVRLAKKVFNPSTMARFLYAMLYQSKHAYLRKEAIHAAFWRRRIAYRLGVLATRRVYIVDAFAECDGGFYSPFVKGRVPTHEEALQMRSLLHPLELEFHLAGMPVWSFGETLNWRWRDNVLLDKKGRLAIPDYEAGLPSPHPFFLIHFDNVNMPKLKRYLAEHYGALKQVLGKKEMQNLEEAMVNFEFHAQMWRRAENSVIINIARGLMGAVRRTPLWKAWEIRRWQSLCDLCRDGTIRVGDHGISLEDGRGRIIDTSKAQKLGLVELVDAETRKIYMEMDKLAARNAKRAKKDHLVTVTSDS